MKNRDTQHFNGNKFRGVLKRGALSLAVIIMKAKKGLECFYIVG